MTSSSGDVRLDVEVQLHTQSYLSRPFCLAARWAALRIAQEAVDDAFSVVTPAQ